MNMENLQNQEKVPQKVQVYGSDGRGPFEVEALYVGLDDYGKPVMSAKENDVVNGNYRFSEGKWVREHD